MDTRSDLEDAVVRQANEISRLQRTVQNLQAKINFYEDKEVSLAHNSQAYFSKNKNHNISTTILPQKQETSIWANVTESPWK